MTEPLSTAPRPRPTARRRGRELRDPFRVAPSTSTAPALATAVTDEFLELQASGLPLRPELRALGLPHGTSAQCAREWRPSTTRAPPPKQCDGASVTQAP